MMNYIKSKLKEDVGNTVSPLDPFSDNKVILPLSHSTKSEEF